MGMVIDVKFITKDDDNIVDCPEDHDCGGHAVTASSVTGAMIANDDDVHRIRTAVGLALLPTLAKMVSAGEVENAEGMLDAFKHIQGWDMSTGNCPQALEDATALGKWVVKNAKALMDAEAKAEERFQAEAADAVAEAVRLLRGE